MKYNTLISILLGLSLFIGILPSGTSDETLSTWIYVDDSNTAGPWDGTYSHPYILIQEGVDHAITDDTVIVLEGTYHENILLNKRIELRGADKTNTIIDGDQADDVVTITSNGAQISSFTIRNSSNESWVRAGIFVDSNENIIHDNILLNNEHGIFVEEAENNTIYNNKISHCNQSGIGVLWDSHNNNISKNTIDNCSRYGIDVAYSQGSQIFKNTIKNVKHYGIMVDVRSNNTNITKNNVDNSSDGVFLRNSINCLIVDNDISNSAGNGGIWLSGTSGNLITQNVIYISRIYGIYLRDSLNNFISENQISQCNQALEFTNSSYNNITRNHISASGKSSTVSLNSHSNHNDIQHNTLQGISISDSDNNTIYYNNIYRVYSLFFIYNSEGNTWNLNYWGRPRLLPKIIINSIHESDHFSFNIDFDLNPTLISYDV